MTHSILQPQWNYRPIWIITLCLSILMPAALFASAGFASTGGPKCDDFDPHRSPFFGDLHVHTSFSMDTLYFLGNPESDPTAAYRFAQGDPIGFPPIDPAGNPAFTVQLDRPLDFAAVTDHAEYFGEVRICETPGHPGYDSPECEVFRSGNIPAAFFEWFFPLTTTDPDPERFDMCAGDPSCLELAQTVWEETRAAAVAADDPTTMCEFTTFVGYEWTANTATANLHRNVIFASEQVPELPVSFLDAPRVEELHEAIENDCIDADIGCDALIIPHNANFSQGRMFVPQSFDGTPFDAAAAERRARMEPLVEIIQHKGASECHPAFSPNDEECGFEILQVTNNLLPPGAEQPPVQEGSFARDGLKLGLEQKEELGVNPFEFGFVGGTDDHNAAAGYVDEEGYSGHLAAIDSSLPGRLVQVNANPGGLTVIWAEENSRESLFEALRRREVYATSGTRPVVRFFGGFRYDENMCGNPSFAARGYAQGVPMGGELDAPGQSASRQAPRFAVSALRDQGTALRPGAPIERIQVIKGWLDPLGNAQEKVFDVAIAAEGGNDSLCTVWSDPEFDPDAPAFYYARVLEEPSPRWHALQCDAQGVDCSQPELVPDHLRNCCADVPREIQERAWTSPIWYYPES